MSNEKENQNKNEEKVVEMEAVAIETVEVDKKAQIKVLAKKGLKIAGVVGVGILGYILGRVSGGHSSDTSIPEIVETEIIDN